MKKVLLASAYRLFLKKNATLLMKRGIQIFTATTGGEAQELHKKHNFDLILIDFKLDDMSGTTLCSLIRNGDSLPQVPIIITCHNLPGSVERAEKCSADVTLTKPIEPIRLMEIIGNFLGLQLGRSKRVVLKVKVLSKIYELEFFCLSHDVSNTGILLETEFDLALGSHVICQFTLPDIAQMEVEGVVSRFMTATNCENLYGVKFLSLPLSARKAIDSYIASIPDTSLGLQNIRIGQNGKEMGDSK